MGLRRACLAALSEEKEGAARGPAPLKSREAGTCPASLRLWFLVAEFYEQPLVEPQVSHLRQVPFLTMVKLPHSEQLSPS